MLDLIFPKRCVVCHEIGSYLCRKEKKKIRQASPFCPVCLKGAVGGTTHERCKGKLSLDGLICLFDYSSPIKEIIHELKYRFVKDLVGTLEDGIKDAKILNQIDFSTFTLVPIPLATGRKNWRGFNQAEILGELITRRLKINSNPEILRKTKETKPQAKLPRKERLRQVSGTFRVTGNISGQGFIVFDDVWTTGATIKAAAAALKRRGAVKVWGLALASSHGVWRRGRDSNPR